MLQVSDRLLSYLQDIFPQVQRQGLDEYYIDATTLDTKAIQHEILPSRSPVNFEKKESPFLGHTVGDFDSDRIEHLLLAEASNMANSLRTRILKEFGMTSSAGRYTNTH